LVEGIDLLLSATLLPRFVQRKLATVQSGISFSCHQVKVENEKKISISNCEVWRFLNKSEIKVHFKNYSAVV